MATQKRQNKKEEVQISLLPDQAGKMERESRMRGILIGILAVLIVTTVGASLFLRFRAEKYRDEKARLERTIEATRAEFQGETRRAQQVGNLGQRAGVAKSLLENHVASEKALLFLEATTVPEVTLKQFALSAAGSLVVSGRGSQFSALARQLQSWKTHSAVTEVTMSGISVAVDRIGNIEGVDFTSTVTLDKGAFRFEP